MTGAEPLAMLTGQSIYTDCVGQTFEPQLKPHCGGTSCRVSARRRGSVRRAFLSKKIVVIDSNNRHIDI